MHCQRPYYRYGLDASFASAKTRASKYCCNKNAQRKILSANCAETDQMSGSDEDIERSAVKYDQQQRNKPPMKYAESE